MSKPFRLDRKTGKKLFLRKAQWKAIYFMIRNFLLHKGAALFMDMGLGKTAAVLMVIRALMHCDRLDRPVLVVGPIRVIYTVWMQEAKEWSHTKNFTFSIIHGSKRKRIAALQKKANIYLINHENIRWLLKALRKYRKKDKWPFSMLVIDESSAYKTAGSKRFSTLRWYVHLFRYRVIMTGTPRPNSLYEVWPQMFIVDLGKRLGTAFGRFKTRFFAPENEHVDYPNYIPRKGAEKYIHNLIRDVAVSMEAKDWLDYPPTIPNPVYVDLPEDAREQYDEFEEELFLQLQHGDVDAVTAASLSMRCWQMANGAVYTTERKSGKRIWEEFHQAKLDALEEIIQETGSPVLVAYWFKHDIIRLRKRYPKAPAFGRQRNSKLEDEWNAGKHPIVFCHYRSAAHGMNLQFGGHTLALFSLTWSYELYVQLINRIGGARAQRRVIVNQITARRTTDIAMIERLKTKEHGNKQTLRALNNYRKGRYEFGAPRRLH